MGWWPYCPSQEVSYCTFGFGAIILRDLHILSLPCDLPHDNLCVRDLSPRGKGNSRLTKLSGGLSYEKTWRYINSPPLTFHYHVGLCNRHFFFAFCFHITKKKKKRKKNAFSRNNSEKVENENIIITFFCNWKNNTSLYHRHTSKVSVHVGLYCFDKNVI